MHFLGAGSKIVTKESKFVSVFGSGLAGMSLTEHVFIEMDTQVFCVIKSIELMSIKCILKSISIFGV